MLDGAFNAGRAGPCSDEDRGSGTRFSFTRELNYVTSFMKLFKRKLPAVGEMDPLL